MLHKLSVLPVMEDISLGLVWGTEAALHEPPTKLASCTPRTIGLQALNLAIDTKLNAGGSMLILECFANITENE